MPENTLAAFDYASRLGVEMLEFDMQMTADGQIVITHDTRVNAKICTPRAGSTARPGNIRQKTLAELQQFDCGSARRPIYPNHALVPGAGMPTLDEVLARYKDSKIRFFGEIKMPREGEGVVDPVEITKRVESLIAKHGVADRFILQSFDWRTIDAMHAIDPGIATCLLGLNREGVDALAEARKHNARCVVVRRQFAGPDRVRELNRAKIFVMSDVVDTEAEWLAYARDGYDAIFTNDPAGALNFFSSGDRERK